MMLELETEPHYPRHTRDLPPEAGAERRGDHYRVIPGDGDHHHPAPGDWPGVSDHRCHYHGPRASTLLAEQSFDLFDVFQPNDAEFRNYVTCHEIQFSR